MQLPPDIASRLRPHQVGPATRLLELAEARENAVDLSDTGTGKTYVTAAVLATLREPALVVLPKVAATGWQRAAEHFGDSISTVGYEMARTGHSPFGHWDNNPPKQFIAERFFKCQSCQRRVEMDNFDPCYCHPLGIHCVETKKQPWKFGKFNWHPAVKRLVFDEGHRCNGIGSRNSELLIAAKRQRIPTTFISATAACSPLNMRASGYLLGLHGLDNFYNWARRNGCGKLPGMQGFHWLAGQDRQREIMGDIRSELVPKHGVRVCIDDIPGFPERDISAELYDLDEGGKIDALYAEMADALKRLEEISSQDKAPDHPLSIIIRARQKIELLKVPLAVELANDYIEKGLHVAIFVNFSQTIDELCRRLNTSCVIDGRPSGVRNRQRNIDDFQSDREPVIIANSQAGGISVSLHDLNGNFPRVGLVFPDFSADRTRQVCGRLQRDGGKSKCFYRFLFAARTVETLVHRRVCEKLNNLDALNDLDMMPENLHLTKTSLLWQ